MHFGLQVGEFCEVHNDSRTDPCAWLARIKTSEIGAYTVRGWKGNVIRLRCVHNLLSLMNKVMQCFSVSSIIALRGIRQQAGQE